MIIDFSWSLTRFRCPCDDRNENYFRTIENNLTICVDQSLVTSMTFKSLTWCNFNASFHFMSTHSDFSDCDFKFSSFTDDNDILKKRPFFCPGNCHPIPSSTLNMSHIRKAFAKDVDVAVTCTLTTKMIRQMALQYEISGGPRLIKFALIAIAFRRIIECNELPVEKAHSWMKERVDRRKLKLAVIYTGAFGIFWGLSRDLPRIWSSAPWWD